MSKELNRRHAYYNEVVKGALKEKFGYKNVMEIPKLDKIVLSLRLGKEKDNAKKSMYTLLQTKESLLKLYENSIMKKSHTRTLTKKIFQR